MFLIILWVYSVVLVRSFGPLLDLELRYKILNDETFAKNIGNVEFQSENGIGKVDLGWRNIAYITDDNWVKEPDNLGKEDAKDEAPEETPKYLLTFLYRLKKTQKQNKISVEANHSQPHTRANKEVS